MRGGQKTREHGAERSWVSNPASHRKPIPQSPARPRHQPVFKRDIIFADFSADLGLHPWALYTAKRTNQIYVTGNAPPPRMLTVMNTCHKNTRPGSAGEPG